MKQIVCDYYREHKEFVHYLLISVAVTIVDIVVARVLESLVGIVIANTVGVLTGMVLQYAMLTKKVYRNSDVRTLVIFALTFILGLIMANLIVFLCREYLFANSESLIAFLISKGCSIVIPFFGIYFLRRRLIGGGKHSSEK